MWFRPPLPRSCPRDELNCLGWSVGNARVDNADIYWTVHFFGLQGGSCGLPAARKKSVVLISLEGYSLYMYQVLSNHPKSR